jgi:predicted dehydrogenase
VLIEKPLVLSLDDADALIEAARGTNARVLMGFHMRWHRLVRRARAIARGGALGDLESIRATWYSPRDDAGLPAWKARRDRGGGVLVEIAVHHFDLWRYLLGTEVAEVHARTRHGRRDDEAAVVSASLANGMLASVALSERTGHDIELELCGDRGRLRLACQRFDGLETYAVSETGGMVRPRLRNLRRTVLDLPRGLARIRKLGDYGDSYRAQWQHFVDAVRTGTQPDCTLEDGREALRVVLAATASAARGMPVAVADAPRAIAPARPHQ